MVREKQKEEGGAQIDCPISPSIHLDAKPKKKKQNCVTTRHYKKKKTKIHNKKKSWSWHSLSVLKISCTHTKKERNLLPSSLHFSLQGIITCQTHTHTKKADKEHRHRLAVNFLGNLHAGLTRAAICQHRFLSFCVFFAACGGHGRRRRRRRRRGWFSPHPSTILFFLFYSVTGGDFSEGGGEKGMKLKQVKVSPPWPRLINSSDSVQISLTLKRGWSEAKKAHIPTKLLLFLSLTFSIWWWTSLSLSPLSFFHRCDRCAGVRIPKFLSRKKQEEKLYFLFSSQE